METVKFSLKEIQLSEAIQEFLNDNIEKLMPALTFSEQDRNDRVEISEISVNNVQFAEGDVVLIDYEYEWSFFSGCKDIDKIGSRHESTRARLEEGHLVFDVIARPEPRTTNEEF